MKSQGNGAGIIVNFRELGGFLAFLSYSFLGSFQLSRNVSGFSLLF